MDLCRPVGAGIHMDEPSIHREQKPASSSMSSRAKGAIEAGNTGRGTTQVKQEEENRATAASSVTTGKNMKGFKLAKGEREDKEDAPGSTTASPTTKAGIRGARSQTKSKEEDQEGLSGMRSWHEGIALLQERLLQIRGRGHTCTNAKSRQRWSKRPPHTAIRTGAATTREWPRKPADSCIIYELLYQFIELNQPKACQEEETTTRSLQEEKSW